MGAAMAKGWLNLRARLLAAVRWTNDIILTISGRMAVALTVLAYIDHVQLRGPRRLVQEVGPERAARR